MWNDWLDRMERMLTSLWAESQVVCYLWAILMFGFRTFFSDSFTKAEANMRTTSRESLKASKHILHIAAHCCTTCNAKTVSVCERDWKRLLDATGCPWILLDSTGNVLGMYWECTGNVLGMYWECTGNVLGMYWCHLTILTERHLWRNDKASWFILHWGLGWWIEQEKLRRVEIARLSESIVR